MAWVKFELCTGGDVIDDCELSPDAARKRSERTSASRTASSQLSSASSAVSKNVADGNDATSKSKAGATHSRKPSASPSDASRWNVSTAVRSSARV